MIKIGFLGPKGTFSQEAVKAYKKGKGLYTEVSFSTIQDAILAVQDGHIDEAAVPIENSLEGAINATLDMMMASEVDLKIKAEVVIDIKQNLMVKRGTDFKDIKHILSHSQPIGQCRKYINAKFPLAKVEPVYSTAEAALEVSNRGNDSAAIGPAVAAEVYGLDIIEHGIQDGDNNLTRFVIISKDDSEITGSDKTSIMFSAEDKPGSLYSVLEIFNLWDINMTRIESRPAKNQLGRYIFFIDMSGHRDEEDIQDALKMVKRKTSFFKFLGSYPEYIK